MVLDKVTLSSYIGVQFRNNKKGGIYTITELVIDCNNRNANLGCEYAFIYTNDTDKFTRNCVEFFMKFSILH